MLVNILQATVETSSEEAPTCPLGRRLSNSPPSILRIRYLLNPLGWLVDEALEQAGGQAVLSPALPPSAGTITLIAVSQRRGLWHRDILYQYPPCKRGTVVRVLTLVTPISDLNPLVFHCFHRREDVEGQNLCVSQLHVE